MTSEELDAAIKKAAVVVHVATLELRAAAKRLEAADAEYRQLLRMRTNRQGLETVSDLRTAGLLMSV